MEVASRCYSAEKLKENNIWGKRPSALLKSEREWPAKSIDDLMEVTVATINATNVCETACETSIFKGKKNKCHLNLNVKVFPQ